jgi:4-phosphopantoate--beta-alanine ligase
VIAIDLNPLSRTAQEASVTIVDNIMRAMPKLVETSGQLKKQGRKKWESTIAHFDNRRNLKDSIKSIEKRLLDLSRQEKSLTLEEGEKLEL